MDSHHLRHARIEAGCLELSCFRHAESLPLNNRLLKGLASSSVLPHVNLKIGL